VTNSIGVGAIKFLVVRKIFARISWNLPEKFLCNFCLQFFFPERSWKPFFGITSKKCFCAKVGCHFLKSNNVGCHIFARISPRFSTNHNFGRWLAPPPPTPLGNRNLTWALRGKCSCPRCVTAIHQVVADYDCTFSYWFTTIKGFFFYGVISCC